MRYILDRCHILLLQACQQYNTKELCDLFDHARSSYYYQSRDKSTKAIIKSIKQISLEVGLTYGRRHLQCQLSSEDHQIGSSSNWNTHWVGDITYIKTYQGWSYLASALDLASRQAVSWVLSKQPINPRCNGYVPERSDKYPWWMLIIAIKITLLKVWAEKVIAGTTL